jgi:aldehyde dehydrogenase (NAD+)
LLDGADFPAAVAEAVASGFLNSGQTWSALTRLIVPRARLEEVEELARAAAETYTVGDPFAEDTKMGPVISAVQRDRVRNYIRIGIDEGAKLVTGGPDAPSSLERGYFVQPTVFSNVTREMTIAREEIFGPVLVVMPYDDEDETVAIANATPYGLAGAVNGEPASAMRVARRMRTGQVRLNGAALIRSAPHGRSKESGTGREHGAFGLQEFLEVKAIIGD